jgi:hypothetical protein
MNDTVRDYYRTRGHLIMAARERCELGPLQRNDWNEDDMTEYRWAVVADASRAELLEQNRFCGYDNAIDPVFRFFYRVVALD